MKPTSYHDNARARYMGQLRAAGVRMWSHQEPRLDTAAPIWDFLVAVFAGGRQEGARTAECVQTGQARAQAHGILAVG